MWAAAAAAILLALAACAVRDYWSSNGVKSMSPRPG
jgi:hypothetical protein